MAAASATRKSAVTRLGYRLLVERMNVVARDRNLRVYSTPGLARVYERRWELMLRRRPVMPLAEYGAGLELDEIEELIPCSACGEERVQPLFHPTRKTFSYRVVRCPSCGFLYRNPGVIPERLGELYSRGNYAKFLTGHYGAARRQTYRTVMRAFKPLFRDGSGRRLLDYGSGAGQFMDFAYRRGFDTYGVDLSPDSVEQARRRESSAKSFHGSPREVPEIAAGGFDVITMWSVLAHLPRPVDDLRMLRELLAPDGVLLILTVNANSLLLKARLDGWGGFTRNHLVFSSPTTLPVLLRKAGFGALVNRPMLGSGVESGKARLSKSQLERMKRNVERGNQGNMQRAVAFADPDGPARWGLEADAVRLQR